tara:strand:- start:3 stop:545 length:543 start_codon:yes stop_codon:yes gene_type:complete
MKLLKFIFFLSFIVLFTNCSDDNAYTTPFILSNENIVGTYNISELNIETKVTSTTDVAGVLIPFTVATSTSNGDIFQFAFVLNSDGTFSASGQFVLETEVTPATGDVVTNQEILNNINSGTYTLNSENAKITFVSSTGDFLEGTYNILIFNKTTLSLNQEIEELSGAITNEINTSISFIR